jgi:glyoxylate carboligase
MKDKVSDFLVKRLAEWGIKRIYGFPGDGINGIVGAFDRAGDLIDFVQVRHEEMAAFKTSSTAPKAPAPISMETFSPELSTCAARFRSVSVGTVRGVVNPTPE